MIRESQCGCEQSKRLGIVERSLFAIGMILLGIYVVAGLDGFISSHLAVWRFESSLGTASKPGSIVPRERRRDLFGSAVNFELWAPERIAAYRGALLKVGALPLGVINVEKLGLTVPVFEGTSTRNLNRGLGWIEGTAKPGDRGNVGIAGHRDGFFRGLKDLSIGDSIKLSTFEGTATYTVERIQVVQPEDVSVLRSGQQSSLTLVTCYPFYVAGNAPDRFIVQAQLKEWTPLD